MARRGAFRAFAAGTAIAGLMGVGAVCVARSYGITSVQQSGAMLKRTPQQGPPYRSYRLRALRTVRTGYAHRPPAWRTHPRPMAGRLRPMACHPGPMAACPGGRCDCARHLRTRLGLGLG